MVVTTTGFTAIAKAVGKAEGITGLRVAEYPGAVGVHPEALVEKNVESGPELALWKVCEAFEVCSPTLGDIGFRCGDVFGDGVKVLEGPSKVCQGFARRFQSLLPYVLVVRHVVGITGCVEGVSDSSQVVQRLLKVRKVIHRHPLRSKGICIVQDLGQEGLEVRDGLVADRRVPQVNDVGKDALG